MHLVSHQLSALIAVIRLLWLHLSDYKRVRKCCGFLTAWELAKFYAGVSDTWALSQWQEIFIPLPLRRPIVSESYHDASLVTNKKCARRVVNMRWSTVSFTSTSVAVGNVDIIVIKNEKSTNEEIKTGWKVSIRITMGVSVTSRQVKIIHSTHIERWVYNL